MKKLISILGLSILVLSGCRFGAGADEDVAVSEGSTVIDETVIDEPADDEVEVDAENPSDDASVEVDASVVIDETE